MVNRGQGVPLLNQVMRIFTPHRVGAAVSLALASACVTLSKLAAVSLALASAEETMIFDHRS